MLKMVVADDEPLIRESIVEMIDWEKHGIEIVGCCKNGIDALDTIIDAYPDIVLTDIRMPGLNGLELIEKIRHTDKDIQIIILSGYKEFEYAKEAMRFGVKQYLLKPINNDRIIEAVEESKKDCLRGNSIRKMLEDRAQYQDDSIRFYKKRFAHTLFSRGGKTQIPAEQPESFYYICYFLYLENKYLKEFTGRWYAFLRENEIEYPIHLLYVKNSAVAVLSGDNDRMDLIPRFVESFRGGCLQYKFEIRGSLSDTAERLAQKLIRFSRILLIDDLGAAEEIYDYKFSLRPVNQLCAQLAAHAENNEPEQARSRLSRFFLPITEIEHVQTYGAGLLSNLLDLKEGADRSLSGTFDMIYLGNDIQEIKKKICEKAMELLFPRIDKESDAVRKMKEYVEAHLSDDHLSLKWIASNYLFLNVNYLSHQFVSETGEKFSSYLNRMRMERAKELLKAYGLGKISEVAQQVGCGNNPRYFGQVFKKFTGMTPSSYITSFREEH